MTPAEANAIIDQVGEEIEEDLAKAFARYRQLVISGMSPRDAVQQVMSEFQPEIAREMAEAFTAILQRSISVESVLAMKVGTVTLSQSLYSDSVTMSLIVQGIVDRHLRGFQSARDLALELYEGYGFKPVEVLSFSAPEELIPKYLKDALLPDLAGDFDTAFARLQVDGLNTRELRAAYNDVLKAIEAIKKGAGEDLLVRRLRVAFEEKARYIAKRIAQTELHRAFALRQAAELMADPFATFVEWRLSASHPREDICDYLAEVDEWGVGPGVYPRERAPVPTAHPFCRCVLVPRVDLYGQTATFRPNAALSVFVSRSYRDAARVAGSGAKLEQIALGANPVELHNEGRPDAYQIRTIPEVADLYASFPEPA